MTDQGVGFVVFMAVISAVLLAVTLWRTTVGMSVIGFFLAISGFGFFAVAKGGIHEATGAVFLIGAALCAGVAGLARMLGRKQGAS